MLELTNCLNTVEAADVLGFHRATVERLCRENRISAKKVHNVWLIDKNEVEKFLLSRAIKARNISKYSHELKNKREQLAILQCQLAAILGVSNTAISRWENSNRNPRAKHSQQISLWLQQVNK